MITRLLSLKVCLAQSYVLYYAENQPKIIDRFISV